MGLDIWLEVYGRVYDRWEKYRVVKKTTTHSLSDMWRDVGVYDALYNSDGKKAEDVLDTLESGLSNLLLDPDRYKAYVKNKEWGHYPQAVAFLAELIGGFKEHPEGVIRTLP